jgi:alcohol dehydrogenase class IV
VTANAGFDALTQLIEAFTSKNATEESDEVCREGIKNCRYLATVVSDGDNLMAREEMAKAAYFSGVALTNVGLGAVHGLASSLGIYTGLPHGRICAILLPHIMEINKSYCSEKYAEIAVLLTGSNESDENKMCEIAISAVKSLAKTFGIPENFKGQKIAENAEEIARECHDNGSMKCNPFQAPNAEYWRDFLMKLNL